MRHRRQLHPHNPATERRLLQHLAPGKSSLVALLFSAGSVCTRFGLVDVHADGSVVDGKTR